MFFLDTAHNETLATIKNTTLLFWKKRNRKSNNPNVCATCKKEHNDLPALGFAEPANYADLTADEKIEIAECDADFCIIRHTEQTNRYIKACIHIPITDTCDELQYGVWVSLSEKSFENYKKTYRVNCEKETYFGRIANWIGCYDESTMEIHVNVETRNGGIRPELKPHESKHLLVQDWINGILI